MPKWHVLVNINWIMKNLGEGTLIANCIYFPLLFKLSDKTEML